MPPHAIDPIVQRLRVLMKESPYLKGAAELYETMLPLLRDANLLVSPVSVTQDEARRKMERGVPLLHDIPLELDVAAVTELMLRLAHSFETVGREALPQEAAHPPLDTSHKPNTSARKIRMAIEENKLDIGGLLPHIVDGECASVTSSAQDLHLDPNLLWILAQNAIRPALRAWCLHLTPVAPGIPWSEGYCFICGTVATLGELQGNNQEKHLRCVQCGADWTFPRLRCMYCGNEDHKTLGHLYPEKQRERMGVEVCHRCNGYLKIIAAFSPTPAEILPVEDLATLHLDYVAQERGYLRAVPQKTPPGSMTA